MPIGEDDLPTPAFTSSAPRVKGGADRRARVFQGGFYRDLHRMLGVASGTEVGIYVREVLEALAEQNGPLISSASCWAPCLALMRVFCRPVVFL